MIRTLSDCTLPAVGGLRRLIWITDKSGTTSVKASPITSPIIHRPHRNPCKPNAFGRSSYDISAMCVPGFCGPCIPFQGLSISERAAGAVRDTYVQPVVVVVGGGVSVSPRK